jgi:gas vesicle protein GvpN
MQTILRVSPRQFVSTPAIERIVVRALRYLQSGFSVHLRGPAGTGKTTLALHLADLLARPMMLVYGDDEFKTSDLIGGQTGYTRKKVVDNFIHSVVKVEDELRQSWIDSRLTLACREGFTLIYDEFNRSRPEVNNVLLSALEEKLLVLPPSNNRSEYLRVNPDFRAIFTSNPEEYVGVHDTQDALLDRLITINIPEPDELTQQEILVQKTACDRSTASTIIELVKQFRSKTQSDKISGLRSCLMLAKICQEHEIVASPENLEFRDLCADILLSRAPVDLQTATQTLWESLNELLQNKIGEFSIISNSETAGALEALFAEPTDTAESADTPANPIDQIPHAQEIIEYLRQAQGAKLTELEKALKLDRVQAVDSLKLLTEQGSITQRYRVYFLNEEA